MQGVVDCYFEEDGGIVVVEYKTDFVRNRRVALERAEAYREQIGAYAKALCRICEKPVKECVLYFLAANEEISVKIG